MKIVFLAIKGIHVIGGIETYTREIGSRLVAQGHEVVVYTLKDEEYNKPFFYEGMQVIPLASVRYKVFAKLSLVIHASIHQFSLKNVDIVHYHAIGPSLFSFIPRLGGRKTIVQSHGHEWMRSSWGPVAKLFFKISEALTFHVANDCCSVSKELKNYYQEKYQKEVSYIPNGVNSYEPRKPHKILDYGVEPGKYILFLGRISREKGVQYLLEAYNALGLSDVKLVIVGSQLKGDSYSKELDALAKNNKNIIFAGEARGDLWEEWYSNASLFVLPSEIEGLPISLLEAMSFARPCLVSNIPENIEALGGEGFTFENTSVESLKEKLREILSNPKLAEELGNRAKIRVEQSYGWNAVVEEFVQFYKKNSSSKAPVKNSQVSESIVATDQKSP